MDVKKINLIWFSPLYHTRELTLALGSVIARALGSPAIIQHDITGAPWEPGNLVFEEGDVAIIAIPVYAGRVPPLAFERISLFSGNGAPAIILGSYGNRAYDNALKELSELASARGFVPFAAAACIARHTIAKLYGEGRPNANDLEELAAFGRRCASMLEKNQELHATDVPGKIPAGPAPVFPLPQSVDDNCVLCGHCWKMCPASAITPERPQVVDAKRCICCMRCVSICPEGARHASLDFIQGIVRKLAPLCAEPKKNEFFGAL